ncbi:MAG: hypothetical protein NT151_11760 [Acidobacteria bacterium]|nr:hypothetical protein [Acidobacteriota bacterium]
MNAKRLAELALKVWGVTHVVGALVSLPAALWIFGAVSAGDPQAAFVHASRIGYVVGLTVQVLAGLAVMVWADSIVALFESDTTPLQVDASSAELQVLGFALAGVFVLVAGLQNAAGTAYVLLSKPKFDETGTWSYVWSRQGEAMVKAAVQIVAGALLVFGREALVRGWSRLRGAPGSDSVDDSDTAG